ncbi:MAG: SurA N-terminal domain-containing protein [Myxococcota bacterium]
MLESLRKGQRWLTLLFVSVIGLVFVFFLGTGGGFGPATPAGNAVVQLDELRLTQTDFARERAATEAQLRAQLGDAFDQIGGSQFVDAQALGALINKVVLADAASELGLHVTREEIRRFVQSSPPSSTKRAASIPRPSTASPATNTAASVPSCARSPATCSARSSSSSWSARRP